MSQLISVPKSIFEELVYRIARLENVVFKKNNDKVLQSIKKYKEEEKEGKLIKMKSVDELFS